MLVDLYVEALLAAPPDLADQVSTEQIFVELREGRVLDYEKHVEEVCGRTDVLAGLKIEIACGDVDDRA